MILPRLLPLGRQVLEENQVRSDFSPCSLHIPSQDKFNQWSLGCQLLVLRVHVRALVMDAALGCT